MSKGPPRKGTTTFGHMGHMGLLGQYGTHEFDKTMLETHKLRKMIPNQQAKSFQLQIVRVKLSPYEQKNIGLLYHVSIFLGCQIFLYN